MTQRLFIILFCFIAGTPLQSRQAAAAGIPNVIITSGNLVKDCRPQIDYAADRGLNIQADVTGDPVNGGWGYHYILEFKEFPEARVFPAEVIARNREQMKANLKYAAQKGVKVYLQHSNFCATRPFVTAHPEVNHKPVLKLVTANWNPTKEEEARANVCGDLCWQDPLYRRFLISCWTELFETYPEVSGLVQCFGEINGCPDDRKPEAYIECARSLFEVVDQTCRKFGKTVIARTWGVRRRQLLLRANTETFAYTFLPKGPNYMMRFSVNNNAMTEPDEEFDIWRKEGHDLWCDVNSRGGNVGSFFYVNPRFQHAVIGSLVKRNVQGLRIQTSDPSGGTNSPVLRFNQEALMQYAHKFEPYDEQLWVRRTAASVGEAEAATVLRACEDASALILGLPRVVSVPEDGYNFSGFYYFPPLSGPPATIGSGYLDPSPDWRRGLTSMREIIKACAIESYTEGIAERVANGRPTPFQTIDGYIAKTEHGAKTLEGAQSRLMAAGKTKEAGHVAQLVRTSRAAVIWGRYWNEMLRARLAYEGVMSAESEPLRQKCAGECQQHYDAGVTLLEQVVNSLQDKGNINDTLRLRKEHRAQIFEQVQRTVKVQPKRPPSIPVGTQVIRNPRFDKGAPDNWDTGVQVGEATFAQEHGRQAGVSVSSGDPVSRAAWSQNIDGNFRQGRYRLHVRYLLQDVRSKGFGGVVRLIPQRENKKEAPHVMIELGSGMSKDWQTLDRELTFDDEAIGLNVGLFLWLSTGKLNFQEVTLTRIE